MKKTRRMNRLVMLEILKELYFLSLKKDITLEDYEKIMESVPEIEVDNNLIAYKETEFLYNLFQKIPYYQVESFLEKFLKTLYEIEEKKDDTSLLDGAIASLLPSVKSRMETEFNAHICELIKSFQDSNAIKNEKIMESLKKNCYSPDHLTGWDIATYEQLYFFKEENLREKISRTNYYRKSRSEELSLSYMIRYFGTLEKADKFLLFVEKLFPSTKLQQDDSMVVLKKGLIGQLGTIYEKFSKTCLENSKTTVDEHQLTLQFYNNVD